MPRVTRSMPRAKAEALAKRLGAEMPAAKSDPQPAEQPKTSDVGAIVAAIDRLTRAVEALRNGGPR